MTRMGFGFGMNMLPRGKPGESGGGEEPVYTPVIESITPNEDYVTIEFSDEGAWESLTVLVSTMPNDMSPDTYFGIVPEGPTFNIPWDDFGYGPNTELYIRIIAVRPGSGNSAPSNEVMTTVPEGEPALEFDWQSFTVTMGAWETILGWSDGNAFPAFGSVSRNPSTNYPLSHIMWDAANGYIILRFFGDFSAEGLDYGISIDGETYEVTNFGYDGEMTFMEFYFPGDFTLGQEVQIDRVPLDTWRDFTVTTGEVNADTFGYHSPSDIGSINREPNPAFPLRSIYYNTLNDSILAVFTGDVTAALTNDYEIRIDFVAYPITNMQFIFGNTEIEFDVSEGTPWNAVGQDHSVEFEPIEAVDPMWQMFLLEAGNILDVYAGFLAPGALGNEEQIGSTSPNPHTVYQVRALLDAGPSEGYILQVFGNLESELSTKVLEIDGIQTVRMSPPVYVEADNYTNVPFNSETTPRWVVDGQYICAIVDGPLG